MPLGKCPKSPFDGVFGRPNNPWLWGTPRCGWENRGKDSGLRVDKQARFHALYFAWRNLTMWQPSVVQRQVGPAGALRAVPVDDPWKHTTGCPTARYRGDPAPSAIGRAQKENPRPDGDGRPNDYLYIAKVHPRCTRLANRRIIIYRARSAIQKRI